MPQPPLAARRLRRWLVPSLLAVLAGCSPAEDSLSVADRARPGPVFLLGFDGLEPALVSRFEQEGLLPSFSRLRREGAVGNVRSTLPAISPPAWTTVATGSPPADHGVWSFWVPEAAGTRYVDATARLARPMWTDLSAAGHSVGIVNVPVTCPPDSVSGFMISGFPYPEGAPLTFPPELEKDIVGRGYLRDAFGERPVFGREEEWLDRMLATGRARREIGLDLLFGRRPDLSFIAFTTPDRIQHHLWKFFDPEHPLHRPDAPARLRSAVKDVYVWCDDILGQVLRELPADATLFVLSDHGFGPAYRGISKARVLARLPEEQRRLAASSMSLFAGDFYFEGTMKERSAFAEELERLVDENGQPLVAAAFNTRPEVTRGYGADLGPAVVAFTAQGSMFVPGTPSGPIVGALAEGAFSGYHRRLGYFGAFGRPIVAGPVRDLDLQDVPAMAVHILGEAIPTRYLHNIPRRLFPPTYFVERPMRASGTIQEGLVRPGERAAISSGREIEDQLKSLGYVR